MTTTVPPPVSMVPPSDKSGLALASMILGIASMVLCLGPFAGIPAVVCGHIALSRMAQSGGALKGRGKAVAGLVTGYIGIIMLPIIGILAGMLLPAVAAAREKARRVSCMNHLAQIGKSFVIYSMDNDGKYPDDFQAVAATINNPQVFICKSSRHQPGDMGAVMSWTDYAVVKHVVDKGEELPSDSVVAYCRPENHRGRGANVLFADGSVVWMNIDEFRRLAQATGAAAPPPVPVPRRYEAAPSR